MASKATKSSNMGIALSTDSSVPDALQAIRAELKTLKAVTETQYKTEGRVEGFPKAIQEETNIETLIRMHSSIFGKANAYNNSVAAIADELGGLSVPVFKMAGSTPEAFQADIVLRIKVLNVTERKTYLEGLLKEAEQFLTEKDKWSLFVSKISSLKGLTTDDVETEDADQS